jgi:ABC-type antimicrobial peptide transport system permease subunit
VRTETGPLAFSGLLREHVRQLDRDEPVSAVKSMDDLIDDQLGQRHLLTLLLGSFAAMALLLVLLGIYGMIAYSVAERTQEIGIRRALGAQPADVLRLVVGQTFRLALIGVALGILAAFALTRVLRDLLFEVSATDPATFLVVAFLFVFVSLVASYIPARQATRIDPAIALRV